MWCCMPYCLALWSEKPLELPMPYNIIYKDKEVGAHVLEHSSNGYMCSVTQIYMAKVRAFHFSSIAIHVHVQNDINIHVREHILVIL